MKREDIEKAAGDYSGSILGFRDSQSVMAKHKAFSGGAEWRINSVWHDASEEPTKEEMILCADDLGYMWQSDFMLDKVFDKWSDFVKFTKFTKWAYSCDLLPEKGSV